MKSKRKLAIEALKAGDKHLFDFIAKGGLNLKKANLKNLDLATVGFLGINLKGADLRDSDLSLTDFGFEMPKKVKLSVEYDLSDVGMDIIEHAVNHEGIGSVLIELEQEYNGVTYNTEFWVEYEFISISENPILENVSLTSEYEKAYLNSDDREFIRPKIFDNISVESITQAINNSLN